MIPSLFVLRCVLHRVLISKQETKDEELEGEKIETSTIGTWKTQNIHTELIYRLHAKKNIGQAFKTFGAHTNDKTILCVACREIGTHESILHQIERDYPEEFKALTIVSDELAIEQYLQKHVDVQAITKIFNFTKEESKIFSLEQNVLSYLAVRDFN